MPSFFSKVLRRKREDKEGGGLSPSQAPAGNSGLLGGRFEDVSPSVSPNAFNFPELKGNGDGAGNPDEQPTTTTRGRGQEKSNDNALRTFFRSRSRATSPTARNRRRGIRNDEERVPVPQLPLNIWNDANGTQGTALGDSDLLLPELAIGERKLTPVEAVSLVRICSQALTVRGVDTLGIMNPHWYSASPDVQRRLISLFINSLANQSTAPPLSSALPSFSSELSSTRSPHDVAAVLRWGLRHIHYDGDFGKDKEWYNAFFDAERMAEYPPKTFSETLAPLIPGAHYDLLKEVFEIFSSLASHAETNSTSGSKLSKIFGLWLLNTHRVESEEDWKSFYARWETTGRQLEHLFFARIRDEAATHRIPVRLHELVNKYPYYQDSSPTTDLRLLPRSKFTTRLYDALFVRVETELPNAKLRPKSKVHPLRVVAEALSAVTAEDVGSHAAIWTKIIEASKVEGSSSPLSRVFADDTLRFLTMVPDDDDNEAIKSPTIAFFPLSPSSPRAKRLSFSLSEFTLGELNRTNSTQSQSTAQETPLSPLSSGDWSLFSSAGFSATTPLTPLASTLFSIDVERTLPSATTSRKPSSRRAGNASTSSVPRKSAELPEDPKEGQAKAEAAESSLRLTSKITSLQIGKLDEAFVDFWSDALLDKVSAKWPSFVVCRVRPSLASELFTGDAAEGAKKETVQWVVLEQAFVVKPPPASVAAPSAAASSSDSHKEIVERERPSSPASTGKKRFAFWSTSRTNSLTALVSPKTKKDSKEARGHRVSEMGEVVEEGSEPLYRSSTSPPRKRDSVVRVRVPSPKPRKSIEVPRKSIDAGVAAGKVSKEGDRPVAVEEKVVDAKVAGGDVIAAAAATAAAVAVLHQEGEDKSQAVTEEVNEALPTVDGAKVEAPVAGQSRAGAEANEIKEEPEPPVAEVNTEEESTWEITLEHVKDEAPVVMVDGEVKVEAPAVKDVPVVEVEANGNGGALVSKVAEAVKEDAPVSEAVEESMEDAPVDQVVEEVTVEAPVSVVKAESSTASSAAVVEEAQEESETAVIVEEVKEEAPTAAVVEEVQQEAFTPTVVDAVLEEPAAPVVVDEVKEASGVEESTVDNTPNENEQTADPIVVTTEPREEFSEGLHVVVTREDAPSILVGKEEAIVEPEATPTPTADPSVAITDTPAEVSSAEGEATLHTNTLPLSGDLDIVDDTADSPVKEIEAGPISDLDAAPNYTTDPERRTADTDTEAITNTEGDVGDLKESVAKEVEIVDSQDYLPDVVDDSLSGDVPVTNNETPNKLTTDDSLIDRPETLTRPRSKPTEFLGITDELDGSSLSAQAENVQALVQEIEHLPEESVDSSVEVEKDGVNPEDVLVQEKAGVVIEEVGIVVEEPTPTVEVTSNPVVEEEDESISLEDPAGSPVEEKVSDLVESEQVAEEQAENPSTPEIQDALTPKDGDLDPVTDDAAIAIEQQAAGEESPEVQVDEYKPEEATPIDEQPESQGQNIPAVVEEPETTSQEPTSVVIETLHEPRSDDVDEAITSRVREGPADPIVESGFDEHQPAPVEEVAAVFEEQEDALDRFPIIEETVANEAEAQVPAGIEVEQQAVQELVVEDEVPSLPTGEGKSDTVREDAALEVTAPIVENPAAVDDQMKHALEGETLVIEAPSTDEPESTSTEEPAVPTAEEEVATVEDLVVGEKVSTADNEPTTVVSEVGGDVASTREEPPSREPIAAIDDETIVVQEQLAPVEPEMTFEVDGEKPSAVEPDVAGSVPGNVLLGGEQVTVDPEAAAQREEAVVDEGLPVIETDVAVEGDDVVEKKIEDEITAVVEDGEPTVAAVANEGDGPILDAEVVVEPEEGTADFQEGHAEVDPGTVDPIEHEAEVVVDEGPAPVESDTVKGAELESAAVAEPTIIEPVVAVVEALRIAEAQVVSVLEYEAPLLEVEDEEQVEGKVEVEAVVAERSPLLQKGGAVVEPQASEQVEEVAEQSAVDPGSIAEVEAVAADKSAESEERTLPSLETQAESQVEGQLQETLVAQEITTINELGAAEAKTEHALQDEEHNPKVSGSSEAQPNEIETALDSTAELLDEALGSAASKEIFETALETPRETTVTEIETTPSSVLDDGLSQEAFTLEEPPAHNLPAEPDVQSTPEASTEIVGSQANGEDLYSSTETSVEPSAATADDLPDIAKDEVQFGAEPTPLDTDRSVDDAANDIPVTIDDAPKHNEPVGDSVEEVVESKEMEGAAVDQPNNTQVEGAEPVAVVGTTTSELPEETATETNESPASIKDESATSADSEAAVADSDNHVFEADEPKTLEAEHIADEPAPARLDITAATTDEAQQGDPATEEPHLGPSTSQSTDQVESVTELTSTEALLEDSKFTVADSELVDEAAKYPPTVDGNAVAIAGQTEGGNVVEQEAVENGAGQEEAADTVSKEEPTVAPVVQGPVVTDDIPVAAAEAPAPEASAILDEDVSGVVEETAIDGQGAPVKTLVDILLPADATGVEIGMETARNGAATQARSENELVTESAGDEDSSHQLALVEDKTQEHALEVEANATGGGEVDITPDNKQASVDDVINDTTHASKTVVVTGPDGAAIDSPPAPMPEDATTPGAPRILIASATPSIQPINFGPDDEATYLDPVLVENIPLPPPSSSTSSDFPDVIHHSLYETVPVGVLSPHEPAPSLTYPEGSDLLKETSEIFNNSDGDLASSLKLATAANLPSAIENAVQAGLTPSAEALLDAVQESLLGAFKEPDEGTDLRNPQPDLSEAETNGELTNKVNNVNEHEPVDAHTGHAVEASTGSDATVVSAPSEVGHSRDQTFHDDEPLLKGKEEILAQDIPSSVGKHPIEPAQAASIEPAVKEDTQTAEA